MRSAAAGIALLAAAASAWALSAGTPRGLPLIGRPLELAIPVQWDRGEAPPCVRAEFLQGESPGGPLRWRIDRAGDAGGVLRLDSVLPVQEPIVNVQIVLGCQEQYTRQYQLLSEPPSEAREAQAAAALGPELPVVLAPLALSSATTLASLAQPAAREGARSAAAATTPASPTATVPARPQRAVPPRAARAEDSGSRRRAGAAPPARKSAATATASAGRPRLKLEPIDTEIDEAPVLRLSSALSAPAAAASATRAGAQDLWQALSTPPEQQAAQAQAARAVEAELRSMRELVQRYGAESRAATERLEKVSGERDLVLNLLTALLVLFGAGFGYLLWLRSRESAMRRAWWEDEHGAAPARRPAEPKAPVPAPAANDAVADAEPVSVAAAPPADDSAFVDLPDFFEMDHTRLPTAEELLGLKEKADFFLALDQPDKAVQLMESQLHEHTGNSPYVWLDLLDLCRRLERRDDYERLRIAFQKVFSARLPAFDDAAPRSGGLEGHPRALSRITMLWHSPRVLKVIEESLFEESKPGSIPFDLQASRDLLLLFGVASEVLAGQVDAPQERFPDTMLAPMAPAVGGGTDPVPLSSLDAISWPQTPAVPEPEPLLVPPQPPRAAAAPDIDLAEQGQPLLPDLDLDFDLSPAPRADRP